MKKRALICGISGQDGAYLAKLLLEKGYEVCGTSRDAQMSTFGNLRKLGVFDRITPESMSPNDFRSVLQVLKNVMPDEIYNLSGQSSVGLSFQQPVETMESIALATLNLLEAIRFIGTPVRFYNAGSGECFGDTPDGPADEESPFRPKSPYAVAKSAAFWQVANYRDSYGLYACSGILFNHESPLRPERFVTRKIIESACRIAAGSAEKLKLGNLSIRRDWGWAPEYVDAMWRMLQQEKPDDFVIATGVVSSLQDFVAMAFESVGLDWRDHVESDPALLRPSDIACGWGNPAKAEKFLGWKSGKTLKDIIDLMISASRARFESHA